MLSACVAKHKCKLLPLPRTASVYLPACPPVCLSVCVPLVTFFDDFIIIINAYYLVSLVGIIIYDYCYHYY